METEWIQEQMEFKQSPFLEINSLRHNVSMEKGDHGVIYMQSRNELQDRPFRMTERLLRWAQEKPDAVFLAQRLGQGGWQTITYAETLRQVQSLSQFLLDSEVSAERPLAIIAGNSIEHGLMALAALHVGLPYSPISPAYFTKSDDYGKLKHCLDLLTPGLIFVQDGAAFEAPSRSVAAGLQIMAVNQTLPNQISFSEALTTTTTQEVETAFAAIQPNTAAKILFTSGSTGLPKGVINTHGNVTTNWQQITQIFPFMADPEKGVHLIDWLPWNHVFGGNHNFGLTLFNGGSLYIDDGNPTPQGFDKTIANLREVSPTVYFNIPQGFEELVNRLSHDKELSKKFFSRLNMFFYAGASMAQHIWDGLERLAFENTGKRLLISTGLGMTEASPSCMFNSMPGGVSGELGVPVPGLQLKLVPDGDKLEARFKGGNVFPGYWRSPKETQNAFDEEGFYKTGDALKLIDETDPNRGLLFDGRIAEDFKLVTGTWVSVGVLRAKVVKAGNGLIKDVVITGHDQSFLGALIFPEVAYCRKLANSDASVPLETLVYHPKVTHALQEIINDLGRSSTGSSTCVRRALMADFELSSPAGEITDKGSINQRAILKNRSSYVDLLHQPQPGKNVVVYTS